VSHLTPHRSVTITAGGAAATAGPQPPYEPDTSWDGLIADLAQALGLEATAGAEFVGKVDGVVEAIVETGFDLEVARTSVRGALMGNVGMLRGAGCAVDLSDARVAELLGTWVDGDSPVSTSEADQVVARLALLHTDLVEPEATTPGPDDQVGEGEGGSATPLPEPDPAGELVVGQVAYMLDAVPTLAKDVVVWIGAADDADDRRARAQAALEVEQDRTGPARPSVDKAIAGVLGG
jgi:hypothetical protein